MPHAKITFSLACADGTYITQYRPYDYLRIKNIRLIDIGRYDDTVNHTATLTIDRALTINELAELTIICNKTAITQKTLDAPSII